jgi:surface polysaccharide O-acyltransferase-like enzyme
MKPIKSKSDGLRGDYTPSQLQSMTIDLLRFPLAIMVIFIHMNPFTVALPDADFSMLSGRGIFNVIAIMLSHGISCIAVPTFFLISGYLFFIKGSDFTWSLYCYKIKRRLHSLIIPYFLWNALAVLLSLSIFMMLVWFRNGSMEPVHKILSHGWHLFYDCNVWGTTRVDWLGGARYSTGPFDLPLWFLRDLIVVTLLSPVIFVLVKRLKIWGILVMFVAYISRIWFLIPGFSETAFFYFSLGAYLAVNRYSIVALVHRYKAVILPITVILLLSLCYYDGGSTYIGNNIRPFYSVFGVFAAFYIASELIVRYGIKPNKLLVSSCFFVYAMHTIGDFLMPISLSKRIIHFLIPGQSGIEEGLCYVLTPFLTAAICVAVYAVCRKLFPKITLIFSGNK